MAKVLRSLVLVGSSMLAGNILMRALSVAFILCSVTILTFLLSGQCPNGKVLECSIVGLLMAVNGVVSCAIYCDRC